MPRKVKVCLCGIFFEIVSKRVVCPFSKTSKNSFSLFGQKRILQQKVDRRSARGLKRHKRQKETTVQEGGQMRHCGFYKHAEVFLLKANNKERRIKEAKASCSSRVISKMEMAWIRLPTLLVVPMGTLRYHTKNGAHSMHPRVAIGGPIFTTMAM